MLRVDDLKVFHGPVEAVHGVSFSVARGQCVALLGPNGAGKTSIVSAIAGVARATGAIALDGADLTTMSVETRIRRGIAVSPEGRRVFANLTVEENLRLAAAGGRGRTRGRDRGRRGRLADGFDTFPILGTRRDQLAGTLSGGEQQMLAIARALVSRPTILLLDEPGLGLAPGIVTQIFAMIRHLREQGMTILLVEQNASRALRLADHACLLDNGRIVARGTAETPAMHNALMATLAQPA